MQNILLNELRKRTNPIDIIIVGIGFMGFGFLSSLRTIPGFRVPLIISRRPQETTQKLLDKGFDAIIVDTPEDVKKALENGKISVSANTDLIADVPSDVVIEMTGTVAYATEAALKAIHAGKHLVTMNPELQATVGSELKKIADEKGVIITDVLGDQPGSLTRLIAHAKLMGFRPRLVGNMKRYMDAHATQEQMKPWAEDKGLAVRQTVSFTDGTKQAIEMTLVANYFGLTVSKRGMHGPTVEDVKEVVNHFDWKRLPEEGIVDFVIGKSMFPGVFIVAEHNDPHQQQYLRYLGLGEGPQYVLFEPYHLCHLEVPQTIAQVVLYGQETIHNSTTPTTRTVSIAKRDLKKGEILDGIGSDMVYGAIDTIENARYLLPVGLADGAVLKNDIPKDSEITLADVALPDTTAVRLVLGK